MSHTDEGMESIAPHGVPSAPHDAQTPQHAQRTQPLARLRRPEPALLTYYLLQSILAGPGIIFFAPYQYFRYRTLRYIFDEEGITMRWGILFRREITLTYARIQDIHLLSNVVERWLGLGRVQIQTASGSATAEITIEGLPDFEQVRDELYTRMRGARSGDAGRALPAVAAQHLRAHITGGALTHGTADGGGYAYGTADGDVVAALNRAADELRALREELARNRP